MNVKYIRRKCGVRGCKNIGSFSLSRTREMGNSVIICKECLKQALAAAEEYKVEDKPKKASSGIPSLFFVPATLPPISGKGKPLVDPETVDKVIETLHDDPFGTTEVVDVIIAEADEKGVSPDEIIKQSKPKPATKPKTTRKKAEK